MAVSVATLQTHAVAAADAIASGDYATAIASAQQGMAILAGLPDSAKDGAELQWHDRFTALIDTCRRSQAAATGIQTSKITYARVTG